MHLNYEHDTQPISSDLSSKLKDQHPAQFRSPKLSYSYSALEIISDAQSLKNHFMNSHQKFFDEFMEMVKNSPAERMGILQIFKHEHEFDQHLIECAAIVFNHQLFWDNLSPYAGEVSSLLNEAINLEFGGLEQMKKDLIELGLHQNCCGWLWLIVNDQKKLKLISTKDNVNPLMENSPEKGTPILAIDLWEHSYSPKFKNQKEEYLKSVLLLINWKEASSRYRNAI